MRTHARAAVTLCAPALAVLAILACSSSRPPDEVVRLPPQPDAAANNKNITGGSGSGRLCSEDGFQEPTGGTCTCTYAYGASLSITFPCGVTLCTDGKREAAVCQVDGKLTVLPGYDTKNCPDAGSNLDTLPPCDAGAAPLDAASD